MTVQECRAATVAIGCVAVALFCAAPARAGLINPNSTVNIFYDLTWTSMLGPQAAPSGVFNTAAPGPFSLAAPITPRSTPLNHIIFPLSRGSFSPTPK